LPADDPAHERNDVPEPPVILAEEGVQERLVELVVTTRVTVPVKPLTGDTVIVDAPVAPAFALTLIGLALMLKSGALVTW
jgi:hypothetical protein